MSLSRRPTVGLPSNPRARSSIASQARSDIPSRPPSSASQRPPPSQYSTPPPLPSTPRSLRHQRSAVALPARPTTGSVRSRSLDRRAEQRNGPSREVAPPLPSLPRGPRIGADTPRGRAPIPAATHTASRSDDYGTYRRNEDPLSDSASSSGGSEGFVGSPASSRTSMDEMDMEDKMEGKLPAGFGSSLWGSIAGVAGNLTISVSKAWSSKVAIMSGEETPVGGESRLTRAMKAYHIEKARDPADLPDWLFDERERGVRSYKTTAGAPEQKLNAAEETRPSDLSRPITTVRQDQPLPPPRIARGPTLADRKAGAPPLESRAGSEEHVTKSMNRLRELRDAKRRAKVRFDGDEDEEMIPAPREPAPAARPPPEPSFPVQPPRRPSGNMPAPLGASLGGRGRQPSTRIGLPSGVRPVRA
ncbi:hypothetical protein BD309DRAFT_5034 [Dichomitus squalens]|uniref:Uncharacterized protein n=1 Tax=Dichomitus squalens TaxID=114155 RepID=A0A4Q9MXG3_9APHY|nr:hypothetical protein BD311DRAFT_654855 [Dichomitus squalens]TBU50692.1 hypothetical protein BD309DRAFT_5034 [Dichomitus squalens]